jgi:hypothetical protein
LLKAGQTVVPAGSCLAGIIRTQKQLTERRQNFWTLFVKYGLYFAVRKFI